MATIGERRDKAEPGNEDPARIVCCGRSGCVLGVSSGTGTGTDVSPPLKGWAMGNIKLALLLLAVAAVGLTGCGKGAPDVAKRDYVHQTDLKDVRLGDGVPLAFSLSIRWKVEDARSFSNQFADPEQYAKLIFDPKSRELAGKIANAYPSVASVFRPEREKFIKEMKDTLAQRLSEQGILVKEVIIAEALFPKAFTDALEVTATKDLVQVAKEKALAALTAENPSYASYLVNRELASKVQIAVLPLGTESGVLGGMLQNSLGGISQKNKK